MEDGDARFRRLVGPVHDQVLAFARCLSKSRSDGDDLFQESLVRALVKIGDLREDAAFRSWLYRIVITIHRNRCRRAFWRRFLPLGDDAEAEERAHISGSDYRTSDWSPNQAEATQRARAALAVLPAAQREAIVLFEIEGWLVEEIAVIQGVSISAIKSRLARGCVRLCAYYERQLSDDGVPATVMSEDTP